MQEAKAEEIPSDAQALAKKVKTEDKKEQEYFLEIKWYTRYEVTIYIPQEHESEPCRTPTIARSVQFLNFIAIFVVRNKIYKVG